MDDAFVRLSVPRYLATLCSERRRKDLVAEEGVVGGKLGTSETRQGNRFGRSMWLELLSSKVKRST